MNIKRDIDMEENNIIGIKPKLELITGGKEPPHFGSDFLSEMKDGTQFLVKDKTAVSMDYLEVRKHYQRMSCKERPVFIETSIITPNGQSHIAMWVNPVRWCNKYELVDVLWEPEETKDASGSL